MDKHHSGEWLKIHRNIDAGRAIKNTSLSSPRACKFTADLHAEVLTELVKVTQKMSLHVAPNIQRLFLHAPMSGNKIPLPPMGRSHRQTKAHPAGKIYIYFILTQHY